MATKTVTEKYNSIFDLVSSVDNGAEILAESATATIDDYIGTGNYILNACMTGSIFKGLPTGRVMCLAGEPGVGKSFLAISICREAIKKGYTPIYMDSEGSIDADFVRRLGCDPKKMIFKPVTTVSEVSTFMANTLKKINNAPKKEREHVIFVLDSLGNLTSTKELNDVLEDNGKKDMQRAQDIKALFRTNTTALAKAQAPFIVTSHIYKTQDLYAKTIVTGGSGIGFNASLTILLSASKLEDKESDKIVENKVGDFTKTGVIVTAKPNKSRFTIPQKVQFIIPYFKKPNPYIGLEQYLTWENSGILRGKIFNIKEYSKLSDADKRICYEFADENGEVVYAYPKDTSKEIVVKHLGKAIHINELYTEMVFTEDVLKNLDETVIKPLFELPSQDSFDDLKEYVEENE